MRRKSTTTTKESTLTRQEMTQLLAKNPYASENPKDFLAARKLPLNIVPDSISVLASLGFLEGAHKYGQYNWRAKPVKMSVYLSAIRRHIVKLNAGEDCDSKTKIPHISYILCCASIIGDAQLCGTLIDDRPPSNMRLVDFIDEEGPNFIDALAKLFAAENPHQYTIADDVQILKDKKVRKQRR